MPYNGSLAALCHGLAQMDSRLLPHRVMIRGADGAILRALHTAVHQDHRNTIFLRALQLSLAGSHINGRQAQHQGILR